MNMKKLYTFPKRNLLISVPLVLVAGFVIGAFVDTSFFYNQRFCMEQLL